MRQYAEKREDFMQLSMTGYFNYMMKALRSREERILSAWQIPDERQRQLALRSAWRSFGSTWRVANNQLKDLRTKAWRTYRVNLAQCGTGAQDEEGGGMGFDSHF